MQYAIGVDLGGTNIKGGIVGADGALVYTTQVESQLRAHPDGLAERTASLVSTLRVEASRQSWALVGLGLSSTIDVDRHSGRFKYASQSYLQRWVNFPIADFLSARSGLPTRAEHDGFAATWGEYQAGAGRGYRSLLLLTLGTGIGGGAILEGQPLLETLASGGASFGHMSINFEGPACDCGTRGCLEMYASATALEERAAVRVAAYQGDTKLKATPTCEELVQAAASGDKLALALLDETGRYLGLGLVTLLNLFNPEVVLIGGGLARAGDYMLTRAREVMNQSRLPLRTHVPLKIAELGSYSGVVGAALLCHQAERKEAATQVPLADD
jgi:glucokinase